MRAVSCLVSHLAQPAAKVGEFTVQFVPFGACLLEPIAVLCGRPGVGHVTSLSPEGTQRRVLHDGCGRQRHGLLSGDAHGELDRGDGAGRGDSLLAAGRPRPGEDAGGRPFSCPARRRCWYEARQLRYATSALRPSQPSASRDVTCNASSSSTPRRGHSDGFPPSAWHRTTSSSSRRQPGSATEATASPSRASPRSRSRPQPSAKRSSSARRFK